MATRAACAAVWTLRTGTVHLGTVQGHLHVIHHAKVEHMLRPRTVLVLMLVLGIGAGPTRSVMATHLRATVVRLGRMGRTMAAMPMMIVISVAAPRPSAAGLRQPSVPNYTTVAAVIRPVHIM